MKLPEHLHHCTHCVFLGNYNGQDLYYCEGWGPTPTVMARYGDSPDEYVSGLARARHVTMSGTANRALRVAYLIARDKGLVNDEPEQR